MISTNFWNFSPPMSESSIITRPASPTLHCSRLGSGEPFVVLVHTLAGKTCVCRQGGPFPVRRVGRMAIESEAAHLAAAVKRRGAATCPASAWPLGPTGVRRPVFGDPAVLLSCADLHHVVVHQLVVDLLIPVRHTLGNHQNVSLGQVMGLAAVDAFPADFIGRGGSAVNHCAPGHYGGRPFDHVHDV